MIRDRRTLPGRVAIIATLAVFAISGEAAATYPGADGKLAFSARIGADTSNEIYAYDFATQQLSRLTDAPGIDAEPTWHPNGSGLVFASQREDAATKDCSTEPCDFELYTVDADGTNAMPLTNTPAAQEREPAWSPDGERIAFSSIDQGTLVPTVRVMDADGSNSQLLFGGADPNDHAQDPTWSPTGDRIAFANRLEETWIGNSDGSSARRLGAGIAPSWSPYHDWVLSTNHRSALWVRTADHAFNHTVDAELNGVRTAVWSPDMDRVAVAHDEILQGQSTTSIYSVDVDGTDKRVLVDTDGTVFGVDWLASPQVVPGHVRPGQAQEVRVPLVPSHRECTAPNSQHGPPLAFSSCTPPAQGSDLLTVGTPDSNGHQARSVGTVIIRSVPGNVTTPEDEADVALRLDISDVRRRSDLADYTGTLIVPLDIRLTDRNNGCCSPIGGPDAGTVRFGVDLDFGATCAATSDLKEGARCNIATSIDAVVPGAVIEGIRTVWELGPVQVFAQAGDTEPFAAQGVLVP